MSVENQSSEKKSGSLSAFEGRLRKKLPKTAVLRYLMISAFILLMAIILPKDFVPEFNYELGKPWVAPELTADFSFPIYKPLAQYEEEKKAALSATPPVFRMDSSLALQVEKKCLEEINGYFLELNNYRSMVEANDRGRPDLRRRIQNRFGLDPENGTVSYFDLRRWQTTFSSKVEAFVKTVYRAGLADTLKTDLKSKVIYVRKSQNVMVQKSLFMSTSDLSTFLENSNPGIEEVEKRIMQTAILPLLRPNLIFDPVGTSGEQKRALSLVSPVEDKVAKGEAIISKGEPVNEVHDRKITSYFRARTERFGKTPYFITLSGQLVFVRNFANSITS